MAHCNLLPLCCRPCQIHHELDAEFVSFAGHGAAFKGGRISLDGKGQPTFQRFKSPGHPHPGVGSVGCLLFARTAELYLWPRRYLQHAEIRPRRHRWIPCPCSARPPARRGLEGQRLHSVAVPPRRWNSVYVPIRPALMRLLE